MSPVPLGFWAAAGNGGAGATFELISTAYGTGSSGVMAFSSIPQTYKHLQLRFSARSDANFGTAPSTMYLYFNADVGYNKYAYHEYNAQGNGGSLNINNTSQADWIQLATSLFGSGSTSGRYAYGVIDIPDYTYSGKSKTAICLSSAADASTGYVAQHSGTYHASTTPLTTVTLQATSGNFDTSSRFSLYGIKG